MRASLPVDESMVINVLKYGIIQPVRCISTGKGETLQRLVIAGRQRVKAARVANERLEKEGSTLRIMVPVMFESGSDEARTFGVRISENEIRRDDSLLIKASNAVDMATRFGCSRAEIADTFGVSQATISQWFKLNTLAKPVKDAVAQGLLTASGALQLAELPLDKQASKLAEIMVSKSTETTQTEATTPNATTEAPKHRKATENDVKRALTGKSNGVTKAELKAILKRFDESPRLTLDIDVPYLLRILIGEVEPRGNSSFEVVLRLVRDSEKGGN
jgi:ParB family chromosome partitioning protein